MHTVYGVRNKWTQSRHSREKKKVYFAYSGVEGTLSLNIRHETTLAITMVLLSHISLNNEGWLHLVVADI